MNKSVLQLYKNIIEYTSIWKLNISVDLFNIKVKYIDYKKVYPTEYSYKPLIYKKPNNILNSILNNTNNSERFSFMIDNKKFILFDSLKYILFCIILLLFLKMYKISLFLYLINLSLNILKSKYYFPVIKNMSDLVYSKAVVHSFYILELSLLLKFHYIGVFA